MRWLVFILLCGLLLACGGHNKSAGEAQVARDSVVADSVPPNLFPLLTYPAVWRFDVGPAQAASVVPYPAMGLHYRTFQSIVRQYGAPLHYREIEVRGGVPQSPTPANGFTAYLDTIVKRLPQATVIMFHWSGTTSPDSLMSELDMDLYFMGDGDSTRAIYGIMYRPGTFASY